MISFSIPGEPRGKGRHRTAVRRGKNGGFFAQQYSDEKTTSFENLVKHYANLAMRGSPMIEGPVSVSIRAYFSIPKSMKKAQLALATMEALRCQKKPDFDNIGKIVCDAVNKIIWLDDAQVTDAHVIKRYSPKPRVDVDVVPVEE